MNEEPTTESIIADLGNELLSIARLAGVVLTLENAHRYRAALSNLFDGIDDGIDDERWGSVVAYLFMDGKLGRFVTDESGLDTYVPPTR